jgi:hypothetical protein
MTEQLANLIMRLKSDEGRSFYGEYVVKFKDGEIVFVSRLESLNLVGQRDCKKAA